MDGVAHVPHAAGGEVGGAVGGVLLGRAAPRAVLVDALEDGHPGQQGVAALGGGRGPVRGLAEQRKKKFISHGSKN